MSIIRASAPPPGSTFEGVLQESARRRERVNGKRSGAARSRAAQDVRSAVAAALCDGCGGALGEPCGLLRDYEGWIRFRLCFGCFQRWERLSREERATWAATFGDGPVAPSAGGAGAPRAAAGAGGPAAQSDGRGAPRDDGAVGPAARSETDGGDAAPRFDAATLDRAGALDWYALPSRERRKLGYSAAEFSALNRAGWPFLTPAERNAYRDAGGVLRRDDL